MVYSAPQSSTPNGQEPNNLLTNNPKPPPVTQRPDFTHALSEEDSKPSTREEVTTQADPEFFSPKTPPPLLSSVSYALVGVLRTLLLERNMRIHWVSGAAVMLVGMALALPVSARAALLFGVILVLATESLNSALEGIVDLITGEWAFAAKVAKDAAAGTVLLVAVGAAIILADILAHHWDLVTNNPYAVARTIIFGVPFLISLSAILLCPRKGWLLTVLFISAVGFLAPLTIETKDIVFAISTHMFIVGAVAARILEKELLRLKPKPVHSSAGV